MKKTKKIVIVTSGQPCGNPRMVKEAIALHKAKYEVKVLYCPLSPWGDEFDEQLFQENPGISWMQVGAHPTKNPIQYFFVRLRKKTWSIIYQLFGNVAHAALKSSVLYSQELERAALKHQADLYVGHNLGSMKAIVKAAKKHGAKASFDFEDFHRGEQKIESLYWKKVKLIEDEFMPHIKFATCASPLIANAYGELFTDLSIYTINNCFSIDNRINEISDFQMPLKLFWFSQHVGRNRGIEQIIEAIGLLNEFEIELTLLGNINEEVKRYFNLKIKNQRFKNSKVYFLPPESEKRIFEIASQHHIGFASEIGKDLNNNIALSNKIFTYLLSGNAILFSNTNAQKDFFESNSNIGFLYTIGNSEQLANTIRIYIENPKILNEHRLNSLNLSKTLNWENESEKLLQIINASI